jgi:ABC-type polar amino acid transport system ATPase subunit
MRSLISVSLANEGMTMLGVTHETGFACRVADRIVVMDAGQFVEEETPEASFTVSRSERAKVFLAQFIHRSR